MKNKTDYMKGYIKIDDCLYIPRCPYMQKRKNNIKCSLLEDKCEHTNIRECPLLRYMQKRK